MEKLKSKLRELKLAGSVHNICKNKMYEQPFESLSVNIVNGFAHELKNMGIRYIHTINYCFNSVLSISHSDTGLCKTDCLSKT